MYTLHLDQEQAELLTTAAEMAAAAMDVRKRRVDPDKRLADAANMTKLKLEQVLYQLAAGPIVDFGELPEEAKERAYGAAQMLLRSEDDDTRQIAIDKLLGAIFRRADDPEIKAIRSPILKAGL